MAVTDVASLNLDRAKLIEWYGRNRLRSRRLFDLIDPTAYYTRPIALRNPIVFYEGHLPAFSAIALLERGLGHDPVDARLEALFARGIDPESEESAAPRSGAGTEWPSRETVLDFGRAIDEAVVAALHDDPFDQRRPAMRGGEGIFTALEHEAMHQETLLYMWHRLPHGQKHQALSRGTDQDAVLADLVYELGGQVPQRVTVSIPAGHASLGASRAAVQFGWDNEFDAHRVEVPAFDIDVHNITNAEFMEFVEAGGYRDRQWWSAEGWLWRTEDAVEQPSFWAKRGRHWLWHGMFEDLPLPEAWPVYVSWAEADAFARWRGRRLPSEAEFDRAAYGTPSGEERLHPWGDGAPDRSRGNFNFTSWEPVPAGSRPAGASAWGVHDLVGNGWEWTSSVFGPFPGFAPMVSYPEYSADFFDGQHYVMKGASPATAFELVRRSFRNWFRPNYPYVYATFRTAAG